MENPLVSILVTVHNTDEVVLTDCLNSLINQSFKNIEILIVDDGSTNLQTVECLGRFLKTDSRIKLITNKPNKGIHFSRKVLIDSFSGDFAVWVDHDDICSLDMIEFFIETYQKNNKIGTIVKGDFFRFTNGEDLVFPVNNDIKYETMSGRDAFSALLTDSIFPAIWGTLFPRIVLKEIECKPGLGTDDAQIIFQTIKNCSNLILANKVIYGWRDTPGSLMHSNHQLLEAKETYQIWRDYALNNGYANEYQYLVYQAALSELKYNITENKNAKWRDFIKQNKDLFDTIIRHFAPAKKVHSFSLKEKMQILLIKYFKTLFCTTYIKHRRKIINQK